MRPNGFTGNAPILCCSSPSFMSALTMSTSSMSRKVRFDQRRQFRYTTRKRAVSLVTSCCFACCSCIQQRIIAFASNHMRRSGIHITSSSRSCWQCTRMQPDASFEILSIPSRPLQESHSGIIALDMKDGDGNSLVEDCT